MKKLLSFIVAIVLLEIPVFSLAESDTLPFSFDMNGNTVSVTSVNAYTSEKLIENQDVVLVVIDLDVSSLSDDMLMCFFDTVEFSMSYWKSTREYEFLSDVVSVVWPDSKKAQCVKVYNKKSLPSEELEITISYKGEKPIAYITDNEETKDRFSEYKYDIHVSLGEADDFLSMGSDLFLILMNDYHYLARYE